MHFVTFSQAVPAIDLIWFDGRLAALVLVLAVVLASAAVFAAALAARRGPRIVWRAPRSGRPRHFRAAPGGAHS